MPIQLVFEDEYCKTLQELVVALCNDRISLRASDEGVDSIELPTAMTAGGDRNFANVLGPALGRPLAETRERPELVVAIADADRPDNLVSGFRAAPGGSADDAWLVDLEARWFDALCTDPRVSPHQARLRTCVLRWNKESVLIAARPILLNRKRGAAQSVLDGCVPAYESVADDNFTATYRDPAGCMDRVAQALFGRGYRKGREGNDLTREIAWSSEARNDVWRRCPDLRRLVEIIVARR